MRVALLARLLSLVPLFACGPKLIPGTEIEETDVNKQLIDMVEAYRRAMEGRNVDGILKLVSGKFFDDAGTPDGADDVDLAGLKTKLTDWAVKTRAVRVEVQVRRITVENEVARVRYFYDLSYQLGDADGAWSRASDLKEMALRKEDGVWKIASGI
jgi:hypothetical protein